MLKAKAPCDHLLNLKVIRPDETVCLHCELEGDDWVHLRKCQSCGITLCCDSSKNQHASKHAKATGHLVIISAEPGEKWAFCYEHKMFKKEAY